MDLFLLSTLGYISLQVGESLGQELEAAITLDLGQEAVQMLCTQFAFCRIEVGLLTPVNVV